jgi:hypothetical protein
MWIRILLFSSFDLQDANQKKQIFNKKFFGLLLFEGKFTSFLKDKMPKRSHKTVGIKAQKHVDPVDPDPDSDPEHWIAVNVFETKNQCTWLPYRSKF